jgi:alanyl-tRNA synthetase
VSKTDIIRCLVIVEESSIAKGVRRIVAVTGNEASEAAQFADEMELRLAKIEGTTESAKAEMMRAFLAVSDSHRQLLYWITGADACRNSAKAVSRSCENISSQRGST